MSKTLISLELSRLLFLLRHPVLYIAFLINYCSMCLSRFTLYFLNFGIAKGFPWSKGAATHKSSHLHLSPPLALKTRVEGVACPWMSTSIDTARPIGYEKRAIARRRARRRRQSAPVGQNFWAALTAVFYRQHGRTGGRNAVVVACPRRCSWLCWCIKRNAPGRSAVRQRMML